MNEVSHLATDKDIVTMLTAIIGAICLVIGGAIGFFTKYFYESKKLKENKKALRQQMITNNIAPMRQAWINDVRKQSSNFIHQSKVLRMILLSTISNVLKLTAEDKKEREHNASIIYYQLNESAQYLDVLLPYSIKGDKNEPEADKLRRQIQTIIELFDDIFADIDHGKTDNINTNINKILESTNLAIRHTKDVLLKEWRETKSLKEIE
ncbi:hypothetical protein [Proteus mirabilis]|uniref:hypothetical protein n=1 Tax=Proteus mirabilis TaxID=584 RepID=UPI0034D645D5